MSQISVGLAGFGLGGRLFHAPFIAATPELRLTAVATSRRDDVAAEHPEARVVDDWKALAADPAIDAIVVSTPTVTHHEIARAALEAGKHVVVDKPFTATVAEADDLIQLAAARQRVLTVYQNRRWDGDFRTLRRVVDEGRIGKAYYFEAHFDRFRLQIKPGWRESDQPGAGILYDLGAHLIDNAIVLFGTPSAVMADAMAQRPGAHAIDYFHLVLDYGRARAVLHASTLVREPGPRFAIHGDGGSFLKYGMDPQEQALIAGRRPGAPDWGRDNPEQYGLLVRADGTSSVIETLPGDYTSFYAAFAAAVLQNKPIPVDPRDSRNGLAVIEAAQESVRNRRTVAPALA
jgi:predicted dehydrogenase